MPQEIRLKDGGELRIDERLGRVWQDQHGEPVYYHRRENSVSPHPLKDSTSPDPNHPGWSIDRIWSAPILKLIIFIGIFLCVPSWCIMRLLTELVV